MRMKMATAFAERIEAELSDDEVARRSLMMRLYHSRLHGDVWYPAAFVNGHAPELAAQGWIERVGEGWILTPAGIRGWAEMIHPWLQRSHDAATNELRAVLGMPLLRPAQFKKQHIAFLKRIADAGGKLPAEEYDGRGTASIVASALAIPRGEWIEMTAAGWVVLGIAPQIIQTYVPSPTPPAEKVPTHQSKGCVVGGCLEARMVSKAGKVLTMCEAHQKAYWREQKAKGKG